MRHLARADAHGDGPHGSVGGSMGVAADNRHARQGESLLRPDDVDDAVVFRAHGEVAYAVFLTVVLEGLHLFAPDGVVDDLLLVAGGVVVGHGYDLLRAEDPQSLVPQCVEGLRAGHLMGV